MELCSLVALMPVSRLPSSAQFGIGLHHAGLDESDRALVEELFMQCKIQVQSNNLDTYEPSH